MNSMFAQLEKQRGESNREYKRGGSSRSGGASGKCFNCGGIGHLYCNNIIMYKSIEQEIVHPKLIVRVEEEEADIAIIGIEMSNIEVIVEVEVEGVEVEEVEEMVKKKRIKNL